MLSNNIDYFRLKPMNISKITILLDHGYHPDKINDELEKIYPASAKKVKLKLSPKPSKAPKKAQRACPHVGKSGFVPVLYLITPTYLKLIILGRWV